MKAAVADGNNIVEFMQSTGYIFFEANASACSRDLYDAYKLRCKDNAYNALSMKSFCNYLNQNTGNYGISHTNNIYIGGSRRSRGSTSDTIDSANQHFLLVILSPFLSGDSIPLPKSLILDLSSLPTHLLTNTLM